MGQRIIVFVRRYRVDALDRVVPGESALICAVD
jgi:hypothetical protein